MEDLATGARLAATDMTRDMFIVEEAVPLGCINCWIEDTDKQGRVRLFGFFVVVGCVVGQKRFTS
jgi:hypothetical protein